MRVVVLVIVVGVALAALLALGVFRGAPTPSPSPASKSQAASAASVASAEWLTDYLQAQKRAAEKKLPILADFTGSDWCGTCIALKKEVFNTPEFAAWANQQVILLEVDFPNEEPQTAALKQQNLQLATTFSVDQYPTILFLDATGKKIGQTGYVAGGPQAWIAAAENSLAGK